MTKVPLTANNSIPTHTSTPGRCSLPNSRRPRPAPLRGSHAAAASHTERWTLSGQPRIALNASIPTSTMLLNHRMFQGRASYSRTPSYAHGRHGPELVRMQNWKQLNMQQLANMYAMRVCKIYWQSRSYPRWAAPGAGPSSSALHSPASCAPAA